MKCVRCKKKIPKGPSNVCAPCLAILHDQASASLKAMKESPMGKAFIDKMKHNMDTLAYMAGPMPPTAQDFSAIYKEPIYLDMEPDKKLDAIGDAFDKAIDKEDPL